MRLATLTLGLVTFFTATVLAQEIIAPEEWFQSMKVAQGLVARHNKRHSSRHHRGTNRHHHHKNSKNKVATLSGPGLPTLAKRRIGYPSRREIELRATEFSSFRSDEIVAAPANLNIVKEPMARGGKLDGVATMGKASKKAVNTIAGKAKKASNKHEKRHYKESSSSSSKKHHSDGKKTSKKKNASS
ncbi:hypothetical protein EC957_001230 [Mortierella hygrophila]|uniref:Uncharacterized protein n=1 Tax=Mortierella hygrophila TaxID=979708 RepID=A0A9P6F5W9_9FUNG|nr:hypothetical protein EC957_001230 [Mortierella hygrophila]